MRIFEFHLVLLSLLEGSFNRCWRWQHWALIGLVNQRWELREELYLWFRSSHSLIENSCTKCFTTSWRPDKYGRNIAEKWYEKNEQVLTQCTRHCNSSELFSIFNQVLEDISLICNQFLHMSRVLFLHKIFWQFNSKVMYIRSVIFTNIQNKIIIIIKTIATSHILHIEHSLVSTWSSSLISALICSLHIRSFFNFQPMFCFLVQILIEFGTLISWIISCNIVVENLEHESIHGINSRFLPFIVA